LREEGADVEKTLDTVYRYRGFDCEGRCRLRIYQLRPPEAPDTPTVVIATTLPDNPGTSITNVAEELATQVWHTLVQPISRAGDPLHDLLWVEHYEVKLNADGGVRYPEIIATVAFTWHPETGSFSDPTWTALDRSALEALIGQPLGPVPAAT
jgi:hypothetical protein